MFKKTLAFLSFASIVLAGSAATFHVDLYQPTVINGTTFKPGEVKVELKDNAVVFIQGKTTVEAPAKVENAKDKFLYTTVGYKEGATNEIKDLSLKGTTTHVVIQSGSTAAAGN